LEQKRIPRPGQIYKHFKKNLYQIITVAIHSETGEKMVVYQALYGDFKTYVRPLEMFIGEVDREKYPEALQRYRFEPVYTEDDENSGASFSSADINGMGGRGETKVQKLPDEPSYSNRKEVPSEGIQKTEAESTGEKVTTQEEGSINPVLLEFLEAGSYDEKLHILLNKKKYITDKVINDMAVSIDCTLGDGDIEERIAEFAYCLQTHARFESRRLR
jgi:hypothetical protein